MPRSITKLHFVFFLTLSFFIHTALAEPFTFLNRRPHVVGIYPGETHSLSVKYLGITGLHVTFEVLPYETFENRKVYHFKGQAENSALVGLFFKINSSVESWFDYEGLYSHKLILKQDQSNLFRESQELYLHEKAQTHYQNRWRSNKRHPLQELNQVTNIDPFNQDSFSAFYYLRTLPLKEGFEATVPVVSETQQVKVKVSVLGKSMQEYTAKSKTQKTECYEVRLEKFEKDGTLSGNSNRVWLSTDPTHMLVRMDVKARYGHITATLEDFTPGQP